ncbi:Uncharacterised protein [Mycobacterium tuberculosis]|nr:Uncharacterised protein [Mycobacterium tuberculosis]
MRIDDDDFRRFGLADAPITTQAEHVLCVAEAVTVAWHGLHGEERKPSFAAHFLHNLDGGYVDVTF